MRSLLGVVGAFCIAVAGLGLGGVAQANPKYAAFVMHEGTGDVLFSRYADSRRYPASLTKMMTLYVLFEDIEAGRIKLDDKIKVSSYAARQPASKLGLRAGTTIDVETAIEALIIKSANDVASAVAEHVSGSEVAFARRMTRTARDLGMRSTSFRNASGLPNSRQVTTARDMAKLAQRLRQDFPQYQPYFQKKSFTWNGRTYRSHNKVALYYEGATGLKTGYTRASGYNLATTAERDGHKLIGVVLGGRSGATRDRHMRDILTRSFAAIKSRPSRIKTAYLRTPVPALKPGLTNVTLASASLDPDFVTADDLNFQVLAQAVSNIDVTAEAEIGQGDTDADDPRDWSVQVGAYRKQDQALARLAEMANQISGIAPNADRVVVPNVSRGRTLYRARYARVTAGEAEAVCDQLKRQRQDCLALPPGR
ncbi:D-alanyl-D-alanine carboxypeptidase [Parvularcula lutaonensis]|uniref:D-alanyl-D-alanine carboxypeptidase n=1 Tax=Parvularcula lutaonensis TaxID=491923 RepID=A0ABV7MEH9_9PROT|nr:D-alanyl-D-alanine carboxypeptidase [Parvularcula lutaonensis]GGY55310.1 peptidase M15 [Parvularcula lutaonensis]